MPRLALLTNFIPPYHKPVLDALSKRYRDMRILLSTPMESNRPWKPAWDGLDVVVQNTITRKGLWRHPRGFREDLAVHLPLDTVRQLARFKPDVIISWEMGLRTLLALVYRKLHPRSRLIVWAEVAEVTEHGRGWMRNRIRRALPKHVDAFLVTGESGSRYVRSLGADQVKIFKLLYTTDLGPFTRIPVERHGRTARRLLYAGQLLERKGLIPFLMVLCEWASSHPEHEIEFSLAGDGPLRARLESIAVPSNLTVAFLGSFSYEDLPKVYEQAGIFVLPSLADTWGVVVNEAMAAGLPVLGSIYAQAVAEMVADGRNGWIFRAEDAGSIYEAIERSMTSSIETLNEMRRCARETACRLTPEYVTDLIEAAVKASRSDLVAN